jgi:hypothetical protein
MQYVLVFFFPSSERKRKTRKIMTFTMINVNDTVRYAWRGGIKIIAKVLPGKKKGLLQVHKKWKKITIAKSTTTLFIRCRKLLSFQFGGEEKPHEAVMIHRHVIYNASSPFAIISLRGPMVAWTLGMQQPTAVLSPC